MRFQNAVVKPDDPRHLDVQDVGACASVEELRGRPSAGLTTRNGNIGLIAAPVAALIAFIIITTLINHDPAALLANGSEPAARSMSVYHELLTSCSWAWPS